MARLNEYPQDGTLRDGDKVLGTSSDGKKAKNYSLLSLADYFRVAIGVITGAVSSVNEKDGDVVLDADDISDATTTNKYITPTQTSKLATIETGATADQTASEVPVVDAGGFFDGSDVEAVLQELGQGGGLEGWEIAQLLEGDNWEANKTELLRAYATGKPMYVPPGTYELDDCLITMTVENPDFIIWANNVTIKRADDPLLGTRDTEQMLRIEGGGVLRNYKWYGKTIFDGNRSGSYQVDATLPGNGWGTNNIFHVEAGSAPAEIGVCYIEDNEFRDCPGRPFWMNGASSTPRFDHAKIDRIHQRNCGIAGWRFRVRIQNGFVEVGDISTEETGGDQGLRWSIEDGQGEFPGGGYGFELGETSIQGTHTQLLKISSYTQRYPKYGGINWLGVKNVVIGDYFVYNPFRNDDDTLATMDGGLTTRKVIKIGSYVWNKNMSQTYSVDINRLVVRNQANKVGGLPTDVETTLEIDDSSPLFNIGWLEMDGDVQLGRPSSPTELISEPIRIQTLVWHGSNSAGEIDFTNNLIVDNFIITDRFEDASSNQSRVRNIYIEGDIRINSVVRENDCSTTWWLKGTPARDEDGDWGWNVKSNVEIYNGDLGNVYLNLNFGTTGGDSAWRPGDNGFNASVGCFYLKAKFVNCKTKWRNYVIKDGTIITLGNGGLSDARDRIQLEFVNCDLKEDGDGSRAWLLDPTSGLRSTGTSGLVPVPGESNMVDDLGGSPIMIAGTKDLPDGEYIGPSKFINTRFADFDQPYEEGQLVTGYGHLGIQDTGNYYTIDDASGALQELGQKESLVGITSLPEYNALTVEEKALSISYIRRTLEAIYPLNTLTGVTDNGLAPTVAALTGTPPAEISGFTNGLVFDTTGGNDYATGIYLDNAYSELYVQMYVRIISYIDIGNSLFDYVIGVGNSVESALNGGPMSGQSVCFRYQSTAYPNIEYYTQSPGQGLPIFTGFTRPYFVIGEWNKIGIHSIRNGTVRYYFNDVLGNLTRTATDFDFDWIRIGRYTQTGISVQVSGLTIGEAGFVNL